MITGPISTLCSLFPIYTASMFHHVHLYTSLHQSGSCQVCSHVLPFPSPIIPHPTRWAAFCINPQLQKVSPDHLISHSNAVVCLVSVCRTAGRSDLGYPNSPSLVIYAEDLLNGSWCCNIKQCTVENATTGTH